MAFSIARACSGKPMASSSEAAYAREWMAWAAWCVAGEIHVLTLADQAGSVQVDAPAVSSLRTERR